VERESLRVSPTDMDMPRDMEVEDTGRMSEKPKGSVGSTPLPTSTPLITLKKVGAAEAEAEAMPEAAEAEAAEAEAIEAGAVGEAG